MRRAPMRASKTGYWLALSVAGVGVLYALAWLPAGGHDLPGGLEWLPGSGTMSLGANRTGLVVLLATSGAALVALIAGGGATISLLSGALIALALAASGAAFLARHFLLRYAALEVAALCVALAPLVEWRDAQGVRWSSVVYLVLRVGDAGLLIAILILAAAAGTLDIEGALAAGGALAVGQRGWIVAGLALAVWVKAACWPAHVWRCPERHLAPASRAWLYGVLMPNLGLYLLYRASPLLSLSGAVRQALLWVGAVGALAGGISALLRRGQAEMARIDQGAVLGGLALMGAAAGFREVGLVALVAATPLRLLLALSTPGHRDAPRASRSVAGAAPCAELHHGDTPASATTVAGASPCAGLNREDAPPSDRWPGQGQVAAATGRASCALGGGGWAALSVWLVWAAWRAGAPAGVLAAAGIATALTCLWAARMVGQAWRARLSAPERLEGGMLEEKELALAARAAWAGVHALHDLVEEDLFQGLVLGLARGVMAAGRAIHRQVEQEGVEGLVRAVTRTALALGRGGQRWHAGLLRRNLLWVAMALALAVLGLVLWSW